ncbi:glycosyltransferase family 2 protein [Eshraghiella crossota]|uniref:glycosyltransferase family 2 protein n=1 Tax=Eshraghiella crossota TaxID=45851 RepID=UPI0040291AFC
MKASVIITTHNTEKYLFKCIDSIINQTLPDIEIIIVDDASTDNTPKIAENLALQYDNILFLPLSISCGPGGARNKALLQATGEYISFIDSDDWVDLNYLEMMYNKAKQLNADIVTCSLMREYDYNISSPLYKCKYDQDYVLSGETAFRIMTNEYNYGIKFLPSALNKIYKKTFLTDNSLKFPENIYFEDQPFSYSCTLAANKVICIPNVVYHHYKRSGSIVQSFSQKNIDDMMTAYQMIKDYLYKNNIYEKFRFNYYSSLQHFYNLIVRQIFEFVTDENTKKTYLKYSFTQLKKLVTVDEYIDFLSAEELRKHIQPHIVDTTIY